MLKRRALVTGASGFVGRYLVPLLQEKGFEVWASSRRPLRSFSKPVHWRPADLECPDEIFRLIKEARPDVIFHLAGFTIPKESLRKPASVFSVNVRGTIFLLEGVFRYAPRARVLLISSCHVYGSIFSKRGKIRETDLMGPTSPYGASKALMEMVAQNYVKQQGLRVVIARGFNQLGAGQAESYVFSGFCKQIAQIETKKRRPVLEVGNLDLVRDFIHVEDAVRAYLLLADKGRTGTAYNVGSGEGTRLRKALGFLQRQSRTPFRIIPNTVRFRRHDFPSVIADCGRLKRLGWRPRKSVWTGIRELLEEWRGKTPRRYNRVL